MREFTHTKEREVDFRAFAVTNLSRSDIKFASDHITVRLKRSKTDRLYQGISIIMAVIDNINCPVCALRELFERDLKPSHAPLFSLTSDGFPRQKLISILHRRLQAAGILFLHYSGHSFRRGAAQHAKDNGILDEHIQKLGRWSSNAFRLYFDTSQAELFRLNKIFQTDRPPLFSAVIAGEVPTQPFRIPVFTYHYTTLLLLSLE
jgi:integrase